jgi:N-acetylglucosamine transport system permease protein
MNNNRELRRLRWLLLTPALVLFTCFTAIPGVRALIYSGQKWDGFTEPEWVGADNFRALMADDLFLQALKNNALLMVLGGGLTLILALIFASLIHRGIRGSGLFRVAFFFPNILAAVAIAILWQQMYSMTDFGIINAGLVKAQEVIPGLSPSTEQGEALFPFPFTDSRYLIWSIVPMLVWTATGFYMVLFLAAMQSIPEEYYEAATIDGASGRQQFWHITLPLIREVFVVGVVFFIISTAKFFDAVWVMEAELPSKDSHVMATVLYQKVFHEYNVGYAAAVAVVLFVLVLIATLITLKFSRKDALEY